MKNPSDRTSKYRADRLSLIGAVALGTGVMIGAGIFALTGQMAEMTGSLFPLAFLSAALIVSCSAYSYVKLSNAYPSAGGIGMYLEKAYDRTLTTAFHALLMYFSMVIAESFLARTFGSYTSQLFEIDDSSLLAPVLGVGLLLTAFFDLTRIAALDIIFYLIMDIAIHWGVLRHLRKELEANRVIPVTAIVLNMVILGGFIWVKMTSDPFVLIVAAAFMAFILIGEFFFLRQRPADDQSEHSHSH